jgi:hypothetical protein
MLRRLLGPRFKLIGYRPDAKFRRFKSLIGDPPMIVSVICQDDFFWPSVVETMDYDTPDALDHKSMHSYAESEKAQPEVSWLIIEGFMAFYDPRVFSLIDVPLWITVPKEVSQDRRFATKPVSLKYFDRNIWRNHEKYESSLRSWLSTSGLRMGELDGTMPVSVVCEKAMEAVLDLGGTAANTLNGMRQLTDVSAPLFHRKPDYSFRFEKRRQAYAGAPPPTTEVKSAPSADVEGEPPRKDARRAYEPVKFAGWSLEGPLRHTDASGWS